jgi:hypothetical protein
LGWWLLGGLVALAIVVVGGTWLYIHVIEGPAPAPLSLRSAASQPAISDSPAVNTGPAGAAPAGTVTGTWRVGAGSVVGYRVKEVLAGQNNVAVGRTGDISGHLTIQAGKVASASFTVQMATIKSDESQRDEQFDGRIMDTATYPTGTLTLTSPIGLGSLPGDGVIRRHRGVGIDPDRVRRLRDRQPGLRRVRDHPGSRPAGVPDQVQPALRAVLWDGPEAAASGRAAARPDGDVSRYEIRVSGRLRAMGRSRSRAAPAAVARPPARGGG